MELPRTSWPTRLKTDAAGAGAIFIIGQSLADLHIATLLGSVPANKRKTFVVVESSASKALVSYAERFGQVVSIGLKGLMEIFDAAPAVDTSTVTPQPYLAFMPISLPTVSRPATPADVQNLLLGGAFDPAVYLDSLVAPERPYTFQRNRALSELADWKGQARKFLAYSRIGNGKSIFLQQAAVRFAQQGYEVFQGNHLLDSSHAEIDQIRLGKGPFAFIFDGVREYEPMIKAVAQTLDVRDVLLVATRPTAFATDFQNLRNVLGEGFRRIDLDTLPAADTAEIDKLLEFYGLWGGVGGRTYSARMKFIREDCGGETRAVVLHVFRKSEITHRIREPVTKLSADAPRFMRVLAALFAVDWQTRWSISATYVS